MQRIEKLEFGTFDWDDEKEQLNIKQHGIGFDEALVALSQPNNGPIKWRIRRLAICPSFGRIETVIYTMRGNTLRIISARAARNYEKEPYRDHYPGRGP